MSESKYVPLASLAGDLEQDTSEVRQLALANKDDIMLRKSGNRYEVLSADVPKLISLMQASPDISRERNSDLKLSQ